MLKNYSTFQASKEKAKENVVTFIHVSQKMLYLNWVLTDFEGCWLLNLSSGKADHAKDLVSLRKEMQKRNY